MSNLVLDIRAMKPEERKYAYEQSHQLTMQSGSIGYMRGNFGRAGNEFISSWFDHFTSFINSDRFRTEYEEVINALRSDDRFGGLFANRSSMKTYCAQNPEAKFRGWYGTEHGFRADSESYAYLIRAKTDPNDHNMYVYAYMKKFLDMSIEKAAKGIRLVNTQGVEVFRIPDGGRITLASAGMKTDFPCRYIDDAHVEVGKNLYHINQFAEIMSRNGASYAPYIAPARGARNPKQRQDKGREP